VISGLPADRFTFFGFLARKGRERTEAIAAILAATHTAVLYEAPARVAETLRDLEAAGAGDRPAVMARELTKQFETVVRGPVREVAAAVEQQPPRGEVVLVIGAGAPVVLDEAALRARAAALVAAGQAPREVMQGLMQEMGAPRNLAYRIAHE
jgi:16S rRNA (cytidine1402-2'-O)-methyltransferase